MPRIDPLQLLKCLSVLLSPDGGILSRDEVPRLVNLMTKFSKKLVSKCVYVLILKNTESSLVDMFMAEGGWTLIQAWLQDAMHVSNWDLVKEILGLLLICPVDVERLKLNNIPKLVKNLSRRDDLPGVQQLSSQLVQHWLVIVKSSNPPQELKTEIKADVKAELKNEIKLLIKADATTESKAALKVDTSIAEGAGSLDTTKTIKIKKGDQPEQEANAISTGTFYKLSLRDGKQVISKLPPTEEELKDGSSEIVLLETVEEVTADGEKKGLEKSKSSDSKNSNSNSNSKSSSSNKSSSSSRSSSSRDRRKTSSSSSSRSSSRDKDKNRDRDRKDKDRHRSNGSVKHSSSSKSSSSSKDKKEKDLKDKDKEKDGKESKEKQAEKDKDTLAKIKPQSIDKLGRIPKKSGGDEKSKENKDVKKKPTMSIEVRKNNEDRPKTVKIFNSKMRSTGLEEEVKPPPPRPVKKPSVQLPTIPPKRPSPPRDVSSMPPEKKLKVEIPERPGAIKLIPPKPKPAVLQESDIFMDALTAASAKKEPKKRKRRASVTKDTPSSPTSSATEQPSTPSSPINSPLGLKNIAPINFYQDTLAEDSIAEKENTDTENKNDDSKERSTTPTDCDEDGPKEAKIFRNDDGLKGVLLYSKKKGPKKSITWKTEADLVEVRYFELDETERVNVTKTFMDMAKMDISGEREAIQQSRKLTTEDLMEPQTLWRLPYIIDQPDALTIPGGKSLEKDIQFAREKSVLQALYFDKRKIPDSPEEPIPENHQMSDPVIIPLEDSDSGEIDMRNTPWPEPKGSPPHVEPQLPPQVFPNMPGPFNPNFSQLPPPGFQGIPPRFNGPGGPGNFGPPNMMPNGNIMGPPNMVPPPEMMNHQGPINPNIFVPGPGGPDGFVPVNDNQNNFPMPFNPPNMNMFPPNNFNMNRGGGNRGGFRRGGGNNNGPWVRMNGPGPGPGPGNWNRGGGGHHRGGRLCKNVKNHGYCRNRDNCPFVHP